MTANDQLVHRDLLARDDAVVDQTMDSRRCDAKLDRRPFDGQ